jgi:hypothetical protein
MSAVPKAVPSAVAPSAQNSVPVLKTPQLGPYAPMTGSAIIPEVPQTEIEGEIAPNPSFAGPRASGGNRTGGSPGAPSLPVDGFLFRAQPIDDHYTVEYEGRDPYTKVNNPPTRGMFTWIKDYLNHIALSPQDVDPNGFRTMPGQQRTSHLRTAMPPHGAGFAPETFQPKQGPQAVRFNRYQPVIGTDAYGTGVLNSDTYGAGQTAGGIGGNQYTPTPGPPPTTSTAGGPNTGTTSMPTWG